MADIKQFTDEIANARYGEEVRSSIINALNKVNDDNNSYIQIKNDVISAKDAVDALVHAFDIKVKAAEGVTTALVDATNTGNTAKDALVLATTNANKAKSDVDNSISTATAVKSDLAKVTGEANTAITTATEANRLLNTTVGNAGTANSALSDVIKLGNALKKELDTSTQTGQTISKSLDGVITNATKAKETLQNQVNSADQMILNLNTAIRDTNLVIDNLNTAKAKADLTLQSITSENTAAEANIKELRSENFNSQEILAGVTDIRAYLGMIEGVDIVGLSVDYQNKAYERLASAKGLNKGADFDKFTMYGGRKRCTVDDSGKITSWYGDPNYVEDGSIGQVMVYQPKFYYMVCPVVYEPIETGIGYHLRKANYYVSDKPHAGFRVHPSFRDAQGHEVEYILEAAFEGSLYDNSAKAYLKDDEQVGDFTTKTGDKLCSISGARPASGYGQNLTRPNVETIAQNRGAEWHGDIINIESADELLMIIEAGTMNTQTAYGQGVVNFSYSVDPDKNCSYAARTGSTSSLGNASGKASSTLVYEGGTESTQTADGKTSISWRGKENPYGNIWKFVYGVNMYGNGSMGGGQPYICNNFNFAESKNTDNYEPAGFTVANKGGYISAMGYSTHHDYLFMASETDGNSSVPVGDYTYVAENLNGYRIARLGGYWADGDNAGAFSWYLNNGVGIRARNVGARLVYVPVFDSLAHNNAVASWKAKMTK